MACKNKLREIIAFSKIALVAATLFYFFYSHIDRLLHYMPCLLIAISGFVLIVLIVLEWNTYAMNRKGKILLLGFFFIWMIIGYFLAYAILFITETLNSKPDVETGPPISYCVYCVLFIGVLTPLFLCFVTSKILKRFQTEDPFKDHLQTESLTTPKSH
jgi:hypothetical protein